MTFFDLPQDNDEQTWYVNLNEVVTNLSLENKLRFYARVIA